MKRLILTLTIGFALATTSYAQFEPHPKGIDYTENFRGQYHFSPKTEWMNDVNALMYHDGKYHMIYQWGKRIRHGGYATSRDLLHWKDEGVALIPQDSFLPKEAVRNVSGSQVYSGSGVVVSGEVEDSRGVAGRTGSAGHERRGVVKAGRASGMKTQAPQYGLPR